MVQVLALAALALIVALAIGLAVAAWWLRPDAGAPPAGGPKP
jgi:hypothetical protein